MRHDRISRLTLEAYPAVPGGPRCGMRALFSRCSRRRRRGAQWPRADRFAVSRDVSRRDELRRLFVGAALVEGFCLSRLWRARAAALKSRAYPYECLDCGRQTSATAGTVMHRSKLPLRRGSGRRIHGDLPTACRRGNWRINSASLTDRLAADAEIAPVDGRPGSRSLGGRRRGRSGGNSLPRRRRLFRARQCRQNPRRRGRRGDRSRHQSAQAATQARQIPRYALRPNTPR